jgi:hypothetical protein
MKGFHKKNLSVITILKTRANERTLIVYNYSETSICGHLAARARRVDPDRTRTWTQRALLAADRPIEFLLGMCLPKAGTSVKWAI